MLFHMMLARRMKEESQVQQWQSAVTYTQNYTHRHTYTQTDTHTHRSTCRNANGTNGFRNNILSVFLHILSPKVLLLCLLRPGLSIQILF